jgi:tetratricopeptide (TPR) repeat protein
MQRYDKISEINDIKIKKALSENKQDVVDRLMKNKISIDELLTKCGVKIDCDFVRKNMAPKFHQNPTDVAYATKIFRFMFNGGCVGDPLWLEAAEVVHKDSPDYGLAKTMGLIYAKNGKMDKAEALINEAASLASTPAQKAESFILQGDFTSQKGNKSAAREFYRKALIADPSEKEGYEKIGDLYMGSFKDCAKNANMAEDRLVYIAAYDMYAKAGNQQKMAQARAQFPSVTELFELNWKEGDTKSISCWVGETVSLRTRGKE